MPEELRVTIELERSIDSHEAQWHTRHDDAKYQKYEEALAESYTLVRYIRYM